MDPFKYTISSVQPNNVAASEGSSNFGHQQGDKEESHTYLGVQKITDKPIYIGQVRANDGDATKNKQPIYLGKFDKAVNAAKAHDMVALKLWAFGAKTDFPESDYKEALEVMTDMTQTEVVDTVRRLSFSFVKYISTYHGVTRDLSTGKWEANIIATEEGHHDERSYLGSFDTEEEAARAYDIESIRLKGLEAVTNFSFQIYDVQAIMRGQTDVDKVIIHQSSDTVNNTLRALQRDSELTLHNIISQGTSAMFNATGQYQQFGIPILENSSNMIPINVPALTSSQIERPSLNSSSEANGQGSSGSSFKRDKHNPYAKFIKKGN